MHIFFEVADFRIVFAGFTLIAIANLAVTLLSQLFKLLAILPQFLPLIPRVFPIVVIGEPRAVGAISVAASKLIQNIDFDFVIYSSFLFFT